jgi:hypothetical protein
MGAMFIIGGGWGQAYSHKLLQLLPLHAGGELALLICVEAITMPFVSLGSPSDVGL